MAAAAVAVADPRQVARRRRHGGADLPQRVGEAAWMWPCCRSRSGNEPGRVTAATASTTPAWALVASSVVCAPRFRPNARGEEEQEPVRLRRLDTASGCSDPAALA
jgi:hypothetical protein